MAFYAAVFSAAAPAHASVSTSASMLAVVVVVSLTWYGLAPVALSQSRISSAYQKARKRSITPLLRTVSRPGFITAC
nr:MULTISPECIES: hypothetical protein [unclassified Pseudomonas]